MIKVLIIFIIQIILFLILILLIIIKIVIIFNKEIILFLILILLIIIKIVRGDLQSRRLGLQTLPRGAADPLALGPQPSVQVCA